MNAVPAVSSCHAPDHRLPPGRSERGQAAVFILAFLGVVLLAAILLFKSGRLTTEKMELQNGADAAAYSASLLEARSMNFAAYTNRAMVANEVAVGQVVGLLSWADEIVALGETLELLGTALDLTVALAEVGAVLNTVGEGFIDVGESIDDFLLTLAPGLIRGISAVNEVYSVSQEVYHLTTMVLVANAIFQVLADNVPGTPTGNVIERLVDPGDQGARLSPLGLIALAGHMPSYVNGFSSRYALSAEGNSSAVLAGMGRLAATVREGRDPFSSGDTTPVHGHRMDRGWDLGGSASAGIDLHLLSISAGFSFGFESSGGSEIRYKNNAYVWSAVDTADWEDEIYVRLHVPFHTWHEHIRLPGIPLAGGAYQANNGVQSLNPADMPPGLRRYGSPTAYGGAAKHVAAWEESAVRIEANQVPDEPYATLRGYRDTRIGGGEDGIFPFVSPYFLIGVIRPLADIDAQGPQPAAPLDLPAPAQLDGNLGAIAKSEVYFARPAELAYFRRSDGKEEHGSLFSPFWQARLAKSTDLDRFLSLIFQQKIIWLNDQEVADVPGADRVLELLHSLLEKLL